MTTVDWSAMTPQEVWDALASAPKKLAGPWQDPGPLQRHERRKRMALDGSEVAAVFFLDRWIRVIQTVERCKSLEDGMNAADAELRADGWLLL